ncbi:MAG: cytidylate kinase-like family protein [Candidatus Cyclonatronum sp.]|uniref:cytidylate kinase-like family protein n=1 Tax=Cyclonatronum sp. TaxID=3024185 RepID=UPI0025B967D7|nr:cytidylate kinase-like family protein [Cyclonatronum sp.]MCC5933355.1 cytidylate kinase-like family protein [Balneolales bacterium]MCH8486572.1 cytidylate kinase-like family protein [Cyclonatronum sp.]
MISKLTPKTQKSIAEYVQELKETNRIRSSSALDHPFPTITISREFGCAGFPLGQVLVKRLSKKEQPWELYSRELITTISNETDLGSELFTDTYKSGGAKLMQDLQELLGVAPSDFTRYKMLAQNVRIIGDQGNAVIVGAGASILAQKETHFFNVRITGSFNFRVNRVARELGLSRYEAEKLVSEKSKERLEFIQSFSKHDIADPGLYHMILRNDFFEVDHMADLILEGMKKINLI